MKRVALVIAVGSCLALSQPLAAQEEPDTTTAEAGQSADGSLASETQLVFEREVFAYPQFSRRNPFSVLVAAQSGPRFEQIRLGGLIHSADGKGSVALLSIRNAENETADGESPGVMTKRVHVGENWGNVRVLEIRREEILVEVEEFGLKEQRIMRMPARSNGARGGS